MRLKAHDHGNVRALIGKKGGDRPSSLHTRRWRPRGPKSSSWMKSLHGVLRGKLQRRVHGLPRLASGPPPRGGPDANPSRPWFFWYFFQQDRFQDRLQSTFQDAFQDKQTPPSNSLKLIKYETYYIKPHPPLFFHQQNMQSSPQHGSFSLHTMLEGPWLHKTAFPTPMVRQSKGPHHYKVTALGSCVKWP